MTSKWDQERIRLIFYPSWESSGWGRVKYLNHDEWSNCQAYRLMRKSKTRIIRQYSFMQTLYLWHFNVLCYIKNSNMECGTCRLYTFQLNRPMQINWIPLYMCVSAYENFSQASNLNLAQIACKLTYIPYASNSGLKIRKQF